MQSELLNREGACSEKPKQGSHSGEAMATMSNATERLKAGQSLKRVHWIQLRRQALSHSGTAV